MGIAALLVAMAASFAPVRAAAPQERPRARELDVAPGVLPPGPLNAITDVPGVRVGHVTVRAGERVRSGATVVVPHGGNVFREKVPAAIYVANGFGKLTGVTQVGELGEIETPIALTCTLCVPNAANALITHTLEQRGNEDVRSVNFIVGETNDGFLNDIRGRPVREEHVLRATREARGGSVPEGAVGAGTGTVAFGWKGGIGTSSRRLEDEQGGHTVGVLVQSNFGGDLHILGVPVGRELAFEVSRSRVPGAWTRASGPPGEERSSQARVLRRGGWSDVGSIMIVIATDAPLAAPALERLAKRSMLGLARTGSSMGHGSGDYAIAFSTAASVRRMTDVGARRRPGGAAGEADPHRGSAGGATLVAAQLDPLFQAVAEATEEAIYNSLFKATTTSGNGHTVEALPLGQVVEVLRRYGRLSGGS